MSQDIRLEKPDPVDWLPQTPLQKTVTRSYDPTSNAGTNILTTSRKQGSKA